MKIRNYKIWLFALGLFILTGCIKDGIEMFDQKASIYFGKATAFGAESNLLNFSFAKKPTKTFDTIPIALSVSGKAWDKETQVSVVTLDSTLADTNYVKGVEGVDYKILSPAVIPANSYSSEVKIILYRSAQLAKKKISIFLRIQPNENYELGITAQTTYQIRVSYIQKPDTWDRIGTTQGWASVSTNFGSWTETKYKLILEALYNPVADTTVTEFPVSRFNTSEQYVQYLTQVRNYILLKYPGNYSTPLGIGNSLRDPDADNKYIQVGPANY